MAQVIHLTAGPLIGEDFNTFNGMDTVIFDLLAFLAVFSVRADILAVPLSHGIP